MRVFCIKKMATYTDSHTIQEAVYLCNRAVSEKSTQLFSSSLPVEYVISFSGRTDAPEVRLTDGHTHKTTTVTLAAHAHRGLIKTAE